MRMRNRLVCLLLVLALVLGLGFPAAAADSLGAVSAKDMESAVKVITDAVSRMKDTFPDDEAASVTDIFNSFMTAVRTGGSLLSAVNGSVNFLKLIGVIEDGNAKALANITAQLQAIDETLTGMDKKLTDISTRMSELKASSEFNARTAQAIALRGSWNDFRYYYEENGMDALMTKYDSMRLNAMKSWCQNPDSRGADSRITLLYTLGEKGYELSYSPADGVPADFPADGRYLILSGDFLPDAVSWNVNTYQDSIRETVAEKITKAVETGDFAAFESKNFPEFTGEAELSDKFIDSVAKDAVSTLVSHVAAAKINEDAEFPLQVRRQYLNYCSHLLAPDEGIDAVLKTYYLTHAFEFQISDDVTAFLDDMGVKAGAYGAFAMHILGMSDFSTDTEKTDVANAFCRSLNGIGDAGANALTGYGSYCYLTHSKLYFAEVHFSNHGTMDTREDQAVTTYNSCSAEATKIEFFGRWFDGPEPTSAELIGDDNALLLLYTLQSGGVTMDYNFLRQNLCDWNLRDYDTIVTSFRSETALPLDSTEPLRAKNVLGDYFAGNSTYNLKKLPSDAESKYLCNRKMIAGSLLDPASGKLESDRVLSGFAIYGESHALWFDDEAAFLGANIGQKSFTQSLTRTQQANQYRFRYEYDQSVSYNCLVRRSIPAKLTDSGRYDPLAGYQALSEQLRNGFEDVDETDWFYDAVSWALANNVTEGTDETHFSPARPVTRAEVVTFLWRAAGKPASDAPLPFADVNSTAYYADAVCWAAAEGITKGTGKTTFSPDAPVSREQLVTFLYRYAGQAANYPPFAFEDGQEISSWAQDAVLWAVASGIVQGVGGNRFAPKATATRAQIVTTLYRLEQ